MRPTRQQVMIKVFDLMANLRLSICKNFRQEREIAKILKLEKTEYNQR
jgi:hypothetical protein